ncbi:MAG: hypothetical protein ACYDCQ_16795 [Dehalococcoidia bacterium]
MSSRTEVATAAPFALLVGVCIGAAAAVLIMTRYTLREAASDPILEAFRRAPLDDEPTTAEDLTDIAEGRAAIARGEVIAWQELRARRRQSRSAGAVSA